MYGCPSQLFVTFVALMCAVSSFMMPPSPSPYPPTHILASCSQGALDGGLDIPHGDKRFVGFDGKKLDSEVNGGYARPALSAFGCP